MDRIDQYLEELVERLDCDPLRRDEIRLEVHHHLRELVRDEVAAGKTEEEAVTSALAQFGAANAVAERLTAVHRGVPAPRPWRDRPLLVIGLAAAVCVLATVPSLLTPLWMRHFVEEVARADARPVGQGDLVTAQALSRASSTHPGALVSLCQSLAIAVIAWRFSPRRPWLWAVVGAVVVPVLCDGVTGVAVAWRQSHADNSGPSLGLVVVLTGGLRSSIHAAWTTAVATVALPAVGLWLGMGDLRRHRGLLAAGLLAATVCAHPLLGALGAMLSRDPRLADGQFRSLLLGWSSVQWAAATAALWLCARFALPNPGGGERRSVREGVYATLVCAGIASVAAFVLGPHVKLSLASLGVCLGYAVVLAAGAGLVASAIAFGVERRESGPMRAEPRAEPVLVQ